MNNPQYIVAVGASAGGLEALSAFFERTPLDSVSYVIIPHLSPDFKSRMVEILSRHSELEVLEASEGLEVETNKVYLIPNTKYMGIKEGHLFLIEKEGQAQPHMTVDAFFTSLAEERGDKSIGVILSGVGSDGTRGALAIENAGGVIMVQDPSDAKFDGMPVSALTAIDTEYVFPAEEIPAAIQEYVNDRSIANVSNEVSIGDEALSDIISLIKENYPFDFSEYKTGTLERRIRRRMAHHSILEVESFHKFLKKNPAEMEVLISDFLIGVTSFFRDPEAFKVIETEVIPKIISRKAEGELLKIWVTSCATGEEAYSLAILVKEYLKKHKLQIDVKIFATDINDAALRQAAKGVFSFNITKTVSKERISNFFDRGEDSYKIKPEIRELLIFARHDLTKNPPYCYVDLISCRNMLIYIKPVLQKQILAKLAFGLRQYGYLFLGSSENISMAKESFLEINSKWKIYQSTQSARVLSMDGQSAAPISGIPLQVDERDLRAKVASGKPSPAPDLLDVFVSESNFSGVIINEEGIVSESFGDLSPFLKQERFKFKIQELLPETLGLAFSASLQKVLKTSQRVRINNIEFTEPTSHKNKLADLVLSPYSDKKTGNRGFLVLFKDAGEDLKNLEGSNFQIEVQTKEYIAQLEKDLVNAKQNLNSSNEFLENSKEAMQAFNEELLSANEEMQSANEELQSINEELETVNAAHKYTINELTDLNDDLNNYFRSNVNGQLFVDKDILLKKYSPGAVNHINIRESDLGRPLSNITTNIKFETIIEDIKKVIRDGSIVIKEIESNEGRLYQVMTSPYLKRNSEEPFGAIITFYDITELKKTQRELESSSKMLALATVASEMGTWSITVKDRKLSCSARLNEIFGIDIDRQMSLDDLIAQVEENYRAVLLDLIETSILHDTKFDIEFPIIKHEDHKSGWVRAIGNLSHDNDGTADFLAGIMHDVTDRKLDDLRKNDFIAIVSHELKTPLTSVQAFLQILASKAKQTEDVFAVNMLDRTVSQVKKMTVLINGFLNVSRLEAGKIYLNKQSFEIDFLIKEIIAEVVASTTSHDITIESACTLFVEGDRDKIGQVITNFVSNAIKYSEKGTNISVKCRKTPDNLAEFSVTDKGMGIKAEDMDKLFDRYYRIENTSNKTVSGFGIGLYLSAEIIHRHNGRIWVESEIGKGSIFYFSLPLKS